MFDKQHLIKLVSTKMPFGKYAGTPLVDLPEDYVVWFEKSNLSIAHIIISEF